MTGLNAVVLVFIFIIAAIATWIAGVFLSRSTDALDFRLHLGEALGGMILLAIGGSLPEIAITVTACLAGHLGLASGNLIGGIAVQTLALVVCDAAIRGKRPLTYMVGSLIPVLEALLVIVVVVLTMAGGLLQPSTSIGPVSPASIAIVLFWLLSLVILNRVRKETRWEVVAPDSHPGRKNRRIKHPDKPVSFDGKSTLNVILVFLGAALVTLVAGVALANSGNELANRAGINGIIFGATILAGVTALPEISTGIVAVRMGDFQLAMGDIFGGNAFQVCLFVVADLLAGKPLLPQQGSQNTWIAGVGLILTAIYAAGVIVRSNRRIFRLGIDSIAVVVLYAIGIAGLVVITK